MSRGPGRIQRAISELIDAERELFKMKVRGYPVAPVHAIAAVDVDEKKPASLVQDFELYPGKTRTGRLWTYVRDDRPFAGPDPPAAVFFYSPDRGGAHPEQHLAGYVGLMHTVAC